MMSGVWSVSHRPWKDVGMGQFAVEGCRHRLRPPLAYSRSRCRGKPDHDWVWKDSGPGIPIIPLPSNEMSYHYLKQEVI